MVKLGLGAASAAVLLSAESVMAFTSGFVPQGMAHRARLPLQSNTISAHKSQHGVLGSTMLLNNNKKSSSLALKAATVPPPADWQAWQSKKVVYESTTLAPRYASEDWLYNLLTIFSSAMLWRVSSHLFANTLFAVAIWCAYLLMPSLQAACAGFSTVPHSLTGGALGLLLVFRTNTAYERFLDVKHEVEEEDELTIVTGSQALGKHGEPYP